MAQPCRLIDAVKHLLYDQVSIPHVLSMKMDGVPDLNDAVGGVTVTVTDDFSAVDSTITMGEMTLKGEQALRFIQSRAGVGDQLNVSRMQRQMEYMDGFLQAFRRKEAESVNFVLETYDAVSPYMVTDCSSTTLNNLLDHYGDFPLAEIVSPAGENVMGEKYYEFHVDAEALDALILRLFYAPK